MTSRHRTADPGDKNGKHEENDVGPDGHGTFRGVGAAELALSTALGIEEAEVTTAIENGVIGGGH